MGRLRKVRLAMVIAGLVASGVSAAGGAATTAKAAPTGASVHATRSPAATHIRRGITPLVRVPPAATAAATAASAAHLVYYGGPVVSAIKIIQVLYGSGTYRPYVLGTVTPNVQTFYAGIANSAYLDSLSEYNTNVRAANGEAGTGQLIARGSFANQVRITPSPGNSGARVDDTNIQLELKAQVAAGNLPAPDGNTLYAVYFPAGVVITMGGSASGVDFCAYHGTTSSPEMYYSAVPDFSTITSGCGPSGNTEFQNVTAVSAHEMAEVITDPEIGLAPASSAPGPPLAWYDSNLGENGDICNGRDGTAVGGDGVAYTVQKIWSNQQNKCVLAPAAPLPPPPPPPPRFSPQGVGAPQVAVTPDGSSQLVFWKNSSNLLAEAWYTGHWNGPITFPQLGTMSSTPSAAVTRDGSTQLVFWQGPRGHLYEAWYSGSWNGPVDWTAAWGGRGLLASAPSVVATKDGEQLVYWRGTDGRLWEAWYTGAWNGPADFSTLGTLASSPSATITPDQSQQLVFWQGTDNRLTEVWFAGTWHGPVEFTNLGSISSAPSVVVSTDGSTQLVFYRSPAGDLLEAWYAGSWNGPLDLTSSKFGGTGALTSSPSATVTPDGSSQLVFWQGPGTTLWEAWYAGGAWHGPVNFSAG